MGTILHITSKVEWEKAQKEGFYVAPSLAKEGFIHCSLATQIVAVANCNFKGQQGLVLLEISEDLLKASVKYEDLYNLHELYPHIYGSVNVEAVTRVVPFPPEEDGTFLLPREFV